MTTTNIRVRISLPCIVAGRERKAGEVLMGPAAELGELVRSGYAVPLALREQFMMRPGVEFAPRRK